MRVDEGLPPQGDALGHESIRVVAIAEEKDGLFAHAVDLAGDLRESAHTLHQADGIRVGLRESYLGTTPNAWGGYLPYLQDKDERAALAGLRFAPVNLTFTLDRK